MIPVVVFTCIWVSLILNMSKLKTLRPFTLSSSFLSLPDGSYQGVVMIKPSVTSSALIVAIPTMILKKRCGNIKRTSHGARVKLEGRGVVCSRIPLREGS